jgi:glutaminyl-tRNA synthetase
LDATVRLYDHLFLKEDPSEVEEGQDFTVNLNPNSLEVVTGSKVEPSLGDAAAGARYQFERVGYFCVDPDSQPGKPVFNRTIGLRDSWAKIEKRTKG